MKNKMKNSKKLLAIVMTAVMVVSVSAVIPAMGDGPTVVRFITPSTVSPGQEFSVSIMCTESAPEDIDIASMIDEIQDPGEWSVSNEGETPDPYFTWSTNNATIVVWDAEENKAIKKGVIAGVSYNLTAPDDAAGTYDFVGVFTADGERTPITGANHVTVTTEALFSFTIDLAIDYNMISIPVNDTSVTDASSLATKIGDDCAQISKWDAANQEYVTYLPVLGIDNFDIVGGEGYEVVMTAPETVTFEGKGWESPFTLSLLMDYNMIGIPVNDTSVTDASSLATKIGDDCAQISKWDAANQEYVTYLPVLGIDNFDIVGGEGYEVVMTGPETVPFEGEAWSN